MMNARVSLGESTRLGDGAASIDDDHTATRDRAAQRRERPLPPPRLRAALRRRRQLRARVKSEEAAPSALFARSRADLGKDAGAARDDAGDADERAEVRVAEVAQVVEDRQRGDPNVHLLAAEDRAVVREEVGRRHDRVRDLASAAGSERA